MEDPGGSTEDILPTAPPVNLTNDSLFDYIEEEADKNKFYLPVSTIVTRDKHELESMYHQYSKNNKKTIILNVHLANI